ncbi:MAG TPA: outer membrane protein transport protein [Xanthobacteraceae bacterium]|nr:outer membrane protein transport protein [Xanthobacteraceae bacterium]
MERVRRMAAACAAVVLATVAFGQDAGAGGFAIREQSAAGLGASYAGVAAGGSPASMFWNPATMTQVRGLVTELDAALIFPKVEQTGFGALNALGYTGTIDNSGEQAFVPSSYTSWQLNERFWIGLSINSPFGLSVGFGNPAWVGAAYGQSTVLQSYNAAPSVAFKVNEWLSVGAGAQMQFARANLMSLNTAVGGPNLFILNGDGWGWGFTAGATLTPTPTTRIGVGYRSQIDQEISGILTGIGGATTPGPIETTLYLPDMISVGLRQGLGAGWTLLGTFEWTNWSRIGTSRVTQQNGAPARAASGAVIALPFEYDDGYFYSGGVEYDINTKWTLRAGFGYEQSPIVDRVRTPRLPDNDRYWYSFGATNRITERIVFDFGYSYIDVKDTPINITAASGSPWFAGGIAYTGTASSHVHILSFGAKYRWN